MLNLRDKGALRRKQMEAESPNYERETIRPHR
jgi:hypothetical protein